MTDVLAQDLNDCQARAAKEHQVLKALYEEVGQPHPEQMSAHKSAALGESCALAIRRCKETTRKFYDLYWEDGMGEGNRDRQAFVLWHVAARAAEVGTGWEPKREGSLESVLATYCDDILEARERVGRRGADDVGLGLS